MSWVHPNQSISLLADGLVAETERLLQVAKTEEDLRIGFEKLLEPIKQVLALKTPAEYEKPVYCGRSDALHGQVIIEYERPNAFSSKKDIKHAYEQLANYLSNEASATGLTQLVGVGFDGRRIFFVQFKNKTSKVIDRASFIIRGPYDFTPESARTLLFHLRALSRPPLTAENLVKKFGPQSELAQKAIHALANALKHWGNQTLISTFFKEWKRLFGIVYGGQFTFSYQEKETASLLKVYKVSEETGFQELLFSIHTYFAFLMKLIAAEILTLRETSLRSSLTSQIAHASDDELKRQLEYIENGGIYAQKGISNFLEGDFFRWYLDALDSPELKEVVREVSRSLSEFEPATTTLDPIVTRDLLKRLYQDLVPKEVRHRLGEYYTSDWLAELLLNEANYDGNNFKRLLDPACGSGTFVVLAIQRAIQWGRRNERPDLEIAKSIKANIWGFDLNPLAVIASRTNYLFALGDLVNEILERGGTIEIPIYLCDSVLTPTRTTGNLFGEFLEIPTSVGKFQVPAVWVREGFMLSRATLLVEEMAKNQYAIEEAMERFNREGLVFSNNEQVVKDFYNQILGLEKQNRDGIWARLLKNAFAPIVAGKFDFVVGNPPWIRWDFLSQEYRNATFQLWKDYGLFSLKGFQSRLGGGKKDFSMLFVYASADYYLKDGAKLGFLITQEVFKSKGAGEGFRRFRLGDGVYLGVLKAHDLVSIKPFEGASNKTAAIILLKGTKTKYPVPYFVWNRKRSVGKLATDKILAEVRPFLQKESLIAQPLGSEFGPWQTRPKGSEELSGIKGKNFYKAALGANPNPYGVFWLEIQNVLSDGKILICNLAEKGRQKIQKVQQKIEPDLVYPAIRGADIQRWIVKPIIYMLVVQDPKTRRGYIEKVLQSKCPLTYNYLLKFKETLLKRPLYTKYHQRAKAPFYSQFNISEETFSLFKVVWKRMTNDLVAAVVSQFSTPFGYKSIVPLETTAFIATNNEEEAHYLCALINSKPVRDFIKSFSSAGRGFGTPSVMEHVGIAKYEEQNPHHQRLVAISKNCHELKLLGKEEEIKKLEQENDQLVLNLIQSS